VTCFYIGLKVSPKSGDSLETLPLEWSSERILKLFSELMGTFSFKIVFGIMSNAPVAGSHE